MSRFLVRYVVVLLSLLWAATASGQWQIVRPMNNFPPGIPKDERQKAITAIHFVDEFNGFIGFSLLDSLAIAKTTDAGKTWRRHTLEHSNGPGGVSDIQMVDALNGWATVEGKSIDSARGAYNRGVYRTTDGGLSWRLQPIMDEATSVLQFGNKVVVTARSSHGPGVKLHISDNGGASFREEDVLHVNDAAFVDNLHGVASSYDIRRLGNTPYWYRTTDGGQTWITIAGMPESWSVYGERGTSNFYAAPEVAPGARGDQTDLSTWSSKFYRSTNYGATWQSLHDFRFYTTGDLVVASGLMYVQVDNSEPTTASGLYRSPSKGSSWTSVGGPATTRDSRFAATGCKGGIVYASDEMGNLWKTRTGGDGTIQEPPFTLEFGDDTIRVSSLVCENKTVRFNFRNLYCSPDSVVSIELDPANNATITGAMTLASLPQLPKVYQTDQGDHFDVVWDPSKLVTGDTTVHVRVRLRYYSTATKTLIDTVVIIQGRAQGAPPTAQIADLLDMGDLPSCAPSDSLFTITNSGCDTLYIQQPNVPAGSGVTIVDATGNAIVYPIAIPPGETDSIYVIVERNSAGMFATNITLPASHQKIAGTLDINVRGNVVVTEAAFSIAFDSLQAQIDSILLDRGTMTRCDPPQEFYLYVKNPGCTEVALRNVMFEGDSKIFDAEAGGTLPDTLTGVDLHRVKITITPNGLGPQAGRLRVRYKIGDDPSVDLFYTFTVDIGYGTRTLSIADYVRDLDTIEYCQTRDSVIRFQNTGCDTLTLTDATLNGADFLMKDGRPLPRQIAPGAYDSVLVRYDPRLPGGAMGGVTFTTDADSLPQRTVNLQAYALPTDTVSFKLIPDREIVNSNDTLSFLLMPDTTIRGKGLRSLSLILNYNGDVLTYMSVTPLLQGLTILQPIELETGLKARQLALTLLHPTDIALDSLLSLISLRFRTTLSDSTYATMNLTDFAMNGGDPEFGKCVLGSKASQSSITLNLLCGDSTIKQTLLLNKLVLSVNQPWPNPSSKSRSEGIRIPYVLNAASPLHLRVFSIEGNVAYEDVVEREVGEGSLDIPMQRLTSGTYYFSVSAGESVMRGQFIVTD